MLALCLIDLHPDRVNQEEVEREHREKKKYKPSDAVWAI